MPESATGSTPAFVIPASQSASPIAGATVVATATNSDINVWLTPAGTLATCTYQLPAEAVSRVGQVVTLGTSATITLLTISGASTIFNALNTLNAGDCFEMMKVATNTWARVQ